MQYCNYSTKIERMIALSNFKSGPCKRFLQNPKQMMTQNILRAGLSECPLSTMDTQISTLQTTKLVLNQ